METAALARCTGDPERFLSESWDRAPLLHDAGSFDDLLSLDDVDALITRHGLRAPAFRLVREGGTLPTSSLTRAGRIGSRPVTDLIHPGRVFAAFADGATIVLQGLHRYWEPLTRFCRDLERALHHPVQANAYITPPGSSGLHVHADAHDVFALQTVGTKHWLVYKPGDDTGSGEPVIDHTMTRGEALYLPRGTPHAPRALEALSVHITVGIRPLTWRTALQDLVASLLEDERFDAPIPPGYVTEPELAHTEADDRLTALSALLAAADGSSLVAEARRRFHASRQPLLDDQLRQLEALDRIGDDTWLRPREPDTVLDTSGTQVRILLPDRVVTLPRDTEPAVRALLVPEGQPLRAVEPWLDAEGRHVLARRLVREGVLIATHD